jgi:hypothetical protein
VKDPSVLPGPDARWIYLGKDVGERRRVESLLGPARRFELGGRLHEVAARLRQPYLDFVGEVGARQRDPLVWWSTGFSWKSGTVSDLFLLVCYLRLARELLEQAVRKEPRLLVVIEDPWLFRQVAESWTDAGEIQVQGTTSLWRAKARSVLLCVGKRGWWLARIIGNYLRQRWVWGRRPVAAPTRASVALYSYPLDRCLKGDAGWHDPFLPHVDSLLESLGYEVRRFSPPEAGGFEREVATRHRYFHPLILYATVSGVCRALLAFWSPRWPERLVIEGAAVRYLAEREWWEEIGRSALCVYRLFYECLKGMLRSGHWRWLVYPFENQPWEKLASLCARESGVGTVGIQHAIFSTCSMSYFLGAGEAARMPLPDLICASGPHPVRLLTEGGIPQERLRMPGSVRYGHLGGNGAEQGRTLGPAPMSDVLVALPIEINTARHLLSAIRAAFPSGGDEEGLRFHIKTHPMCPLRESDIGFPALRAPGEFMKALAICGLVIFAGSTVGPEAMALGRRVLRYRPELLLNVDPSEVYGDRIPTCSEADFRAAVLAEAGGVVPGPGESGETHLVCARRVFAPLDRRALTEVFAMASAGARVSGSRRIPC